MNIEESFTCPVCLELAKNAVETECCAKIYCEPCIQDIMRRFGECPCCRSKALKWHQSRIARKVISEIKVPCQVCKEKIETGSMEQHLTKCPKVPIQCALCKENLTQESIPKHTATVHQKQAKEYLINYALGIKEKPKVNQNQPAQDIQGLFAPVKNRQGLMASLGTVGKYYCGGKLQGACGCCNGFCGPDNGQNCDPCMQLDVKRWRLDKEYLVNTGGYVCQVLRVNGASRVSCFRQIESTSNNLFGSSRKVVDCKPGSPCTQCAQMENSLMIGRYGAFYTRQVLWLD